ncbi:histidine kinase [Flagellimonas sp. HMM57]|uniref:histidine kinase n=1 Tax=unclassified Flagellimonas TaxID=2644544 RepID=UPI0013D2A62F|nr:MULTISPECIES: histidine kinase [unclassified Flagellimonas]UII77539.1 histidine kinase [Flagellimonas sp. HMM57]
MLKDNRFEDILIYFSKSMMGKENEEDILWDLAKNCISKLGFVDCVIYLKDQENKFLIQKAAYGPKSPKEKTLYNPVKIAVGNGITGMVALNGVAEIISDTSKDDRYIVDDEARLSEICVPIAYESQIFGVLDCEHPEKGFFNHQHLRMLSAVASICAIKIKNVRDNKSLLEKQENLLKVKAEMVGLKLKVLNSQLNPHFVFNALNAIQYFITSEQKKSALEYMSVFSKLIRFYLKGLDSDTASLKEEIKMLNLYLKLQKLRYNNKFEYTISIKDKSERVDTVIPASVIQTLFENIIEYAIFSQHKNEKLNINFEILDKTVVLKVDYEYYEVEDVIAYEPEYRKRVVQWEDHIKLLNSVKNYTIEKEVSLNTERNKHFGEITLKLPDLS